MPRKGQAPKREVLPDPIYKSKTITKLINKLMVDGKKGKAEKILYSSFEMIREKTGEEPLDVFEKAIENIKPILEVRSQRIGGANYQIPMEVSKERRETLGLRWLVNYSRLRGDKTMEERLAHEIIDGANETGAAFKKKEDMHRMADANKAFAHYRR